MSDPRDQGFNYGTGWGSAQKPPVYLEAMKLSRKLNGQRVALSQAAWALDMALWRVRIASTGVEKVVAVRELEQFIDGLQAGRTAPVTSDDRPFLGMKGKSKNERNADATTRRDALLAEQNPDLPPPKYFTDG